MMYGAMRGRLPRFLRDYVLHFEASIERAVAGLASSLPDGARVLDAGAGEGKHARYFARQAYCAVDLGIGDPSWDYGRLDALADLAALPFPANCFEACVNVVTLEHVREPASVIREIARTLAPGGRLLLVVPQEWEVHQSPHDYFRYTEHGLRYLLESAGLDSIEIAPVGGLFRLLGRRLLNALQYCRGMWFLPGALFLVPPGLVLPLFDFMDHERKFTLGYICTAKKKPG
jgi:SAM-dependent methyltransferase